MNLYSWCGNWQSYLDCVDLRRDTKLQHLYELDPDATDVEALKAQGYHDAPRERFAPRLPLVARNGHPGLQIPGLPSTVVEKICLAHQRNFVQTRVSRVSYEFQRARAAALDVLQSLKEPDELTWADLAEITDGRFSDEEWQVLQHITNDAEFRAYVKCRRLEFTVHEAIEQIAAVKHVPLQVRTLSGDVLEAEDWYKPQTKASAWFCTYTVFDQVQAAVHKKYGDDAGDYHLAMFQDGRYQTPVVAGLLTMELPEIYLYWDKEE